MPPKFDQRKKKIYTEDRLFAAQNKNGEWYLSFTTMDPDEKYKTRFVAKLAEKPSKEMIEEKEIKNDKVRYYLDKENKDLAEHIEEEYKFYIVDEESPYKPKRLGEKRKAADSSDDDNDSDTSPPPQKKQQQKDLTNRELYTLIEANNLLLQEISANLRQASDKPAGENGDSEAL